MSQMKTYSPGVVKVTVATPPGAGWRKSMAVLKGMPLAPWGQSKLTPVWIVLASPLNEGNPTVSPGAMTARDFCPGVAGTPPSEVEFPVLIHVKKFPGLSPASNETTGALEGGAG